MLIKAGFSSKALSLISTTGPVRMLTVVGAENSRSVLLAMTSNSSVKLCLIVESSETEGDRVFQRLDLALMNSISKLSM
jgi:hypothetical protein